ncbi:hypothetical protein BJX68DRAFT_235647 [Aspergillus pseudodeflectus]|uniref:Uncharacterized protein n=1 Tax=Aspergillus pseudodeflectus TaxID=176178 RepID=A0ABR4KHI4_9EURO
MQHYHSYMNKESAFQMPALLRWTARDKPTVCDGILIPTVRAKAAVLIQLCFGVIYSSGGRFLHVFLLAGCCWLIVVPLNLRFS